MDLDNSKPQDVNNLNRVSNLSIHRDRQPGEMSRNGSKAGLNESNRASRAHGISFEEKELTRLKDSSNLSSQKSISKGIYDKED
jgi:hypothetical protein